jgi:hypothetical protein
MTHSQRLREAQEKANMLFKQNKRTNPEKASYYKGIGEAVVWMRFDIDGDLFEEEELCEGASN